MGKKTNEAVARAPVGLTPEEQATQDRFANGSETFSAAPPPDDKKKVSRETRYCKGCSRYHGSVNGEINCLEAALKKKDEKIEALRHRLRLHGDTSGL